MSGPATAARHGLAFAGGGASGAYGVGVTKALAGGSAPTMRGLPLEPVVLAGTSIGAVNAAFLAGDWQASNGASVDRLEAFWLRDLAGGPSSDGALRVRANPASLVRGGRLVRRPLATLGGFFRDLRFLAGEGGRRLVALLRGRERTIVDRLLELTDFSRILTVDPLIEALRRHVDFQAIQQARMPLRVVATGWQGAVQVFRNEDMTEAAGPGIVNASCAIPGLLPPAEVAESTYIDGSMLMYAPVRPAIRAGAEVIHLVHMNTDVASEPRPRGKSSMENLFRALSMMWQSFIENEMAWARSYNAFLAQQHRIGRSAPEVDDLLAEAGLRELRPPGPGPRALTIHRYFPAAGFEGTLAFTNLDRERIAGMIGQGFAETLRHDCSACRCVLPPGQMD